MEFTSELLLVSGVFLLFMLAFVMAAVVEQLRLGVLLLFQVLLLFLIITGKFSGEWQVAGFSLLFLAVMYWAVKALFAFRQFSDLYKISRFVVPGYEAQFFKPVNFNKVRSEYFRGYYLVEYWADGLTVAWHKDKGVVARRNASIEQFKKYFAPEDVVEPKAVMGVFSVDNVGGDGDE